MKHVLTIVLFASLCIVRADEKFGKEAALLRLMHQFSYTESHGDIRKLLPAASEPKPEGDPEYGNTEIKVATKMFGFPVTGEFNFGKGVLVSHGFEIRTKTYKEAHDVFLKCARILDSQVKGIKLVPMLPFGLGDEDGMDGPADEITLQLEGVEKNASFSLSLSLRSDSVRVSFGGQKATPDESEPAGKEKEDKNEEEKGAGKAEAAAPAGK